MDWIELLNQIFELCIVPLIGIVTGFIVKIIRQKALTIKTMNKNNLVQHYIDLLSDTITQCVIATNQTYVDSLKGRNVFYIGDQAEAFHRTYEAVMSILTEEAQLYLSEIYGDLNAYIATKIESEVKLQKEKQNGNN